MRYGILADIHANAFALQAALDDAVTRDVETFVCLGDVVGYHAQPRETIDLLRARGIASVAGNHDVMALTEEPPGGGPNARTAMLWTREALRSGDRAWLSGLPMERRAADRLLLTHAVPWNVDLRLLAPEDFAAAGLRILSSHPWARICCTGHTHVAGAAHVAPDGSTTMYGASPVSIRREAGLWFVNPGSVGLPRDGSSGACYAIHDDTAHTVTFHYAEYDMDAINTINEQNGLTTRVPEPARISKPTPAGSSILSRFLGREA